MFACKCVHIFVCMNAKVHLLMLENYLSGELSVLPIVFDVGVVFTIYKTVYRDVAFKHYHLKGVPCSFF